MRRAAPFVVLIGVVLSSFVRADEPGAVSVVDEWYRAAVVADWKEQEKSFGREFASAESLTALKERAQTFYDWAVDEDWFSDDLASALKNAIDGVDDAENAASQVQKYVDLRTALRSAALANPAATGQPIVFLKQERFVWQMLHEHLSYYYQASGLNGGGVYVLKSPGKSFETESLTDGLFPKGVFQTLSLSYDGKSVYFAFADFSQVKPDDVPSGGVGSLPFPPNFETEYMRKENGKFHLFKMNLADKSVVQLTTGSDDDFDPIETPDGAVVFMSTRRGGFGRCHGDWEPLRVHTLHRLEPNGEITCLSWHETNEWNPTLTNDGRLLYTRWDYVDRDAARHHGLWTTNPDGTNSAILFGNYTYAVNACYQAKAIPDSRKILFIGGAHHLDIGGPIMILDPLKVRYDPETGLDDLSSVENLTPQIPLPETGDAPQLVCSQYFHGPWPLSEDAWLTAYSRDPLGGYLAGKDKSGKTRLYYGDRFGNLELLYQDDERFSSFFPIPLAPREKPPVLPSILPDDAPDYGTFTLSNVYESLVPFPKDRKIKELRIFQLLPKGPDHRGHIPPTGRPYAANARAFLGTVPVEEDGSAYFKAPARLPVYFQAVDEDGKAVQSMRSLVYLQPGENRGCVGCHEQASTVQANVEGRGLAATREPSELTPGPEHTKPFSYPLFVQPILDRNCVSCHHGEEGGAQPPLTGNDEPPYTLSYNRLMDYVRWYEWGGANWRDIATFPGECGTDISPITKILDDERHRNVEMSDADRRNFYLWLDANVPFYGVYDAAEQEKQRRGESVEFPSLQ